MKEKNYANNSLLKRILANCSAQAKHYGSCVATRVPEVEKDMCLKEFLALRSCMQNVLARASPSFLVSRLILESILITMIGEAPSSSSSGFSGSNALSHIYVQYPPLRCLASGSESFFYDDANKLILSLTPDEVFSWKTSPYNPDVAPSSDPISEGPVLLMRYSLDHKLLAIQRSNYEIQIWNKETGHSLTRKCRSESESFLGFFWTDSPTCDIVFVKTSGLDFYSYNLESKSLHLADKKKLNISWYNYTHESRFLLLASGLQCKSCKGYQISSAGTIGLPKFEMVMAKSEANNKPILAAQDVHIVTMYGRIYCLQFDRVAALLHTYRFYRDAVVHQGSLPVYSSKIAVNVVDNVLLIHQVEAKVVIMYDFFADLQAPISAPLPLLLKVSPRTNVLHSQSTSVTSGPLNSTTLSDPGRTIYADQWNFLVPDLIFDSSNGSLWKIHLDLEAISASSSDVSLMLEFLQRRRLEASKAKQLSLSIIRTIILERKPVSVVAKAIDVLLTTYSHAIKSGSYYKSFKGEENSTSGFSETNSPSAIVRESSFVYNASGKSIQQDPKSNIENQPYNRTTLSTTGSVRRNSHSVDSSFGRPERACLSGPDPSNYEISAAGESKTVGSINRYLNCNTSESPESQMSSAAVSPEDLYTFVFSPVAQEMAGEGSYLGAIIIEFLRSASSEKLKVHPNAYVLMVQIFVREERYAKLGLFIMNKIIEPSKEVAMQLLESGRQNLQVRKLGLGMLGQLSLHHEHVLLLVKDGYYLEALCYARKNKVNTVRPSLFLEAAYASKEPQHLVAVLRFLLDFTPGFKNTSDHDTYYGIVAEMASSS